MIAGGKLENNETAKIVEIINMNTRQSSCSPLPHLSIPSERVGGGLALEEVPLVCGFGKEMPTKCYIFINGRWIATDRFAEERIGASLLSFPFKNSR
jgi:hypothetical protein